MTIEVVELQWTGDLDTPGSGASQTWEVPNTARIWVALWGGASFLDTSERVIYAGLDVNPGEILHFNLGGAGQYNGLWHPGDELVLPGGWNGGGGTYWKFPGPVDTSVVYCGAGASDLRRGSNDPADRVLVAGGYGTPVGSIPYDPLGTVFRDQIVVTSLVPDPGDDPRAELPAPSYAPGDGTELSSTVSPSVAGGESTGADGPDLISYGARVGGGGGGGGAGGGSSGGAYLINPEGSPFLVSFVVQSGRAGGFYVDPACDVELPDGVGAVGTHPGGSDFWGGGARIWYQPLVSGWAIDETRF